MTKPIICLAVVALLASVGVVRAQSLADVAKAEEARRKAVKLPSKTYTNDSLRSAGDGSAPVVTPPPAVAAKPADEAAKADAAKEAAADEGPKKDEKYWRGRINAAQQTVARDKVLLDALQSRVNALNTDFANTSDPAQRTIVEANRKTALAEMDRVKKDIETQTKQMADIQEEGRKANVPSGWLR
jgi:hypothetical protein